jgi:hypothetical protein
MTRFTSPAMLPLLSSLATVKARTFSSPMQGQPPSSKREFWFTCAPMKLKFKVTLLR